MEGLLASSGVDTMNHSTEQRLLLGNVVDEGGGPENIASIHQQRRSPMRVWYSISVTNFLGLNSKIFIFIF